jgi:hypothetical protein
MSHQKIIKNLSPSEKIQLMEELWDEIRSDNEYSPPAWHGDVLKERDKALSNGEIGNRDWKIAKEDIRNSLS